MDPGGTWTAAALALLDAVPDGVLICDEDARLVHLHPLTEKIFGVTSSVAQGQDLGHYLASIGDRPFSVAALRERVEGGPDSSVAAVVRHVSGVDIRLLLAARAVEIDGRRLWFLSLRPYPVAQPAPRDQDIYQTVFEHSPVGLCLVDARGVITAVNNAFAGTIGSPRRVLVGMETLTLPDRGMVGDIREALSGQLVHSQRTYRSATGNKVTQVQLVIAPIFDVAHQITGAVIICTDVTAQVEASRALERSLEALHRVMESAPDAITVVRDGRFVLVNSRAIEMFGAADADQLIGRPAADFVHPDDHAILRDRLQQLETPPHSALPPYEYRMLRLDGAIVRVETKSMGFEYEGQPSVLVFGRDVTERRELEARLQQADRMASVGTLAAGVAHEINNPLAYVLMLASQLARRAREGQLDARPVLPDLESILEGSERIRAIVRDLSAFSRRPDESMSAVDLNGAIAAAVNMVRHTLRHRARLVLELSPHLPRVYGDEARLTQVFVNLLVNAAQAIPEGQPDDHTVWVRTEPRDGHVLAAVRDDGRGMPAQVARRIFEPFYTTKSPGQGTGLGLAICHGIVTGHGGTIRVDSREGQGSEFLVELPIDDTPPAATVARTDGVAAGAPRARILVIDDEQRFAASLRGALATRHSVTVAGSGRDALALLLEDDAAFDLILCDVMMPDLTGIDVLEWLERHRPQLVPCFVFMTGGAVTETARQALASTNRPVLAKPFAEADVERVLLALRDARG